MYLAAHILGYGQERDAQMRDKNEKLTKELERHFNVFMPQRDNPYGLAAQRFEMALLDSEAIRKAKIIMALGGFGKDTSWECGFAAAKNKLSVLLLPDEETVRHHISDWMLLLSFRYILVPDGMTTEFKKSPAVPRDAEILEIRPNQDIAGIVYSLYRRERPIQRLLALAKKLFSENFVGEG